MAELFCKSFVLLLSNELADALGVELLELLNSQPSNKHTRLIEKDAHYERKKSRDMSHADNTDLWCFEKVVFLAKS